MGRLRPSKTSGRKNWENSSVRRRREARKKRASWSEVWSSVTHQAEAKTNKHLRDRRDDRREKRYHTTLAKPYDSFWDVLQVWLNWVWGAGFFVLTYLIGAAVFMKFKVEVQQGFLLKPVIWCFLGGGALWALIFYTRVLERFFLFLYVLGHELTHAFFVWVFLGRISDMAITSEGGYVQTRRSNFIIALSPYFMPLLGMVLVALFLGARLVVDIPYEGYLLYGIVGFSWAFHILWTQDMLSRGQSDLEECGSFMSLGIISFFNMLLIAIMVCLATTSWLDLFSFTINTANELWRFISDSLTDMIS